MMNSIPKITVTYEYDCGHRIELDGIDVLILKEEPNWGCRELACDGEAVITSEINFQEDGIWTE